MHFMWDSNNNVNFTQTVRNLFNLVINSVLKKQDEQKKYVILLILHFIFKNNTWSGKKPAVIEI